MVGLWWSLTETARGTCSSRSVGWGGVGKGVESQSRQGGEGRGLHVTGTYGEAMLRVRDV